MQQNNDTSIAETETPQIKESESKNQRDTFVEEQQIFRKFVRNAHCARNKSQDMVKLLKEKSKKTGDLNTLRLIEQEQ